MSHHVIYSDDRYKHLDRQLEPAYVQQRVFDYMPNINYYPIDDDCILHVAHANWRRDESTRMAMWFADVLTLDHAYGIYSVVGDSLEVYTQREYGFSRYVASEGHLLCYVVRYATPLMHLYALDSQRGVQHVATIESALVEHCIDAFTVRDRTLLIFPILPFTQPKPDYLSLDCLEKMYSFDTQRARSSTRRLPPVPKRDALESHISPRSHTTYASFLISLHSLECKHN